MAWRDDWRDWWIWDCYMSCAHCSELSQASPRALFCRFLPKQSGSDVRWRCMPAGPHTHDPDHLTNKQNGKSRLFGPFCSKWEQTDHDVVWENVFSVELCDWQLAGTCSWLCECRWQRSTDNCRGDTLVSRSNWDAENNECHWTTATTYCWKLHALRANQRSFRQLRSASGLIRHAVFIILLSVQCNTLHGTEYKITCGVCLRVCVCVHGTLGSNISKTLRDRASVSMDK